MTARVNVVRNMVDLPDSRVRLILHYCKIICSFVIGYSGILVAATVAVMPRSTPVTWLILINDLLFVGVIAGLSVYVILISRSKLRSRKRDTGYPVQSQSGVKSHKKFNE